MTICRLQNKIKSLKRKITEHESEMASCRYQIELHECVLERVQNTRNQFEEILCTRKNKVKGMQDKFSHMSFVAGYQQDLVGFMEGTEYQQAVEGYCQAEWSIRNNLNRLICHENDLKYEIHIKEEEVEQLERKVRQMEGIR